MIRLFRNALIFVITAVLLTTLTCTAMPYKSYTYDWWGQPKEAPLPYDFSRVIDGISLGTEDFGDLTDIAVSGDRLYALDSDGRIYIIDSSYRCVKVISSFFHDGADDTLKAPQGIFVTDKGMIYVADTDNGRIVKLTTEGEYAGEIGRPETDLMDDIEEYAPLKTAVDSYGRIYVSARAVTDGLIELDDDGSFIGFFGANEVTVNPLDYFKRIFMSEKQWAARKLYLPTEFSNVAVDSESFVYVTTSAVDLNSSSTMPVKRLNLSGTDVLRRNGYTIPAGDSSGSWMMSNLVDIAVSDYRYSILDSEYGRIFTYNGDGELLYAFGDSGQYKATLQKPVAIAYFGDCIVVADSMQKKLVVYGITGYGKLVNDAISLQGRGSYTEAAEKWKEVLKYNGSCDLAYMGLGKIKLLNGDYKTAMEYFELAQNRDYYSRAFTLFRKDAMAVYIPWAGTAFIVLLAVCVVLRFRSGLMNWIRRMCTDESLSE